MEQVISGAGAAMILGAYVALQFGRLSPTDFSYGMLNLFGSALLAGVAFSEGLWAFVVLNSVWALVSLRSLFDRTPRPE